MSKGNQVNIKYESRIWINKVTMPGYVNNCFAVKIYIKPRVKFGILTQRNFYQRIKFAPLEVQNFENSQHDLPFIIRRQRQFVYSNTLVLMFTNLSLLSQARNCRWPEQNSSKSSLPVTSDVYIKTKQCVRHSEKFSELGGRYNRAQSCGT